MTSSITTSNMNTMRTKKLPACIGPGILRTNFADGHPTSSNLQPAWLLSASICIHYIDFFHIMESIIASIADIRTDQASVTTIPRGCHCFHLLQFFSHISPTNIQPDQASISPPVHQGVNSTSNNALDLVIGQVFSPDNQSSSVAGFWKLAASYLSLFFVFFWGGGGCI